MADLKKSMHFYTVIGFTNNRYFTDATAACMVISDKIFLLLLTHTKFSEFTKKKFTDTKTTASIINSLSLERFTAVNEFLTKAIKEAAENRIGIKKLNFMKKLKLQS